MIIPDEVLIFFSIVLIPIKLYIYYLSNINISIMDICYELIFILLDGLTMFLIMYFIRKIGNMIFKTDSMGGGDVKMMAFVSFIIGWKMSIVSLFLAAFLALPLSTINMYKNKEHTLAFGPYLSIATIILFLLKIDFTTIMNLIS
jgi:prepilin signal peptidase PulO-like enzyme (type II secretory pathway)